MPIYPHFSSPSDVRLEALTSRWFILSPRSWFIIPYVLPKQALTGLSRKIVPPLVIVSNFFGCLIYLMVHFEYFRYTTDVAQLFVNYKQNVLISVQTCGSSGLSHITWKIRADLWSRRLLLSLSHTDLFTWQLVISTMLFMKTEPMWQIWMWFVEKCQGLEYVEYKMAQQE